MTLDEFAEWQGEQLHIAPPRYLEVCDAVDNLLGTFERMGDNKYQFRVDGEFVCEIDDSKGQLRVQI
jgi:hypothetical protein